VIDFHHFLQLNDWPCVLLCRFSGDFLQNWVRECTFQASPIFVSERQSRTPLFDVPWARGVAPTVRACLLPTCLCLSRLQPQPNKQTNKQTNTRILCARFLEDDFWPRALTRQRSQKHHDFRVYSSIHFASFLFTRYFICFDLNQRISRQNFRSSEVNHPRSE